MRAWLEQPHGRHHKAPPCILTTMGKTAWFREEIPAFLAHFTYARKMIIFSRVSAKAPFVGFFLARMREKKIGVFLVFWGVLGCFFVFFCFSRVSATKILGLFCALRQAKPGISSLAWLPSDQPHEDAPGWVWWFDAAILRYKEKTCLFVCFFTCSQKNTEMAPFSLISKVCGHV